MIKSDTKDIYYVTKIYIKQMVLFELLFIKKTLSSTTVFSININKKYFLSTK